MKIKPIYTWYDYPEVRPSPYTWYVRPKINDTERDGFHMKYRGQTSNNLPPFKWRYAVEEDKETFKEYVYINSAKFYYED